MLSTGAAFSFPFKAADGALEPLLAESLTALPLTAPMLGAASAADFVALSPSNSCGPALALGRASCVPCVLSSSTAGCTVEPAALSWLPGPAKVHRTASAAFSLFSTPFNPCNPALLLWHAAWVPLVLKSSAAVGAEEAAALS